MKKVRQVGIERYDIKAKLGEKVRQEEIEWYKKTKNEGEGINLDTKK